MNMKRTIKLSAILCCLVIAFSAKASDTLRYTTSVKEVTVFFSGAQINRTANLKLGAGAYIIALENLPADFDPASIQVGAPAAATILSVRHRAQSLSFHKKSAAHETLEKDIEKQKRAIKALKEEVAVFDIEERIMIDNSRLSTRDGVSAVDEIRAAADLYRARLNEIRKAKMALQVRIEEAGETLKADFVSLNSFQSERQKRYSEVVITLESKTALNGPLTLSYYAPSAGWDPLYDFRVSDINMPLSLTYNANVYQSTGEDWKDVKLTLSSSNPQLSGDRPELSPWLISYRRQVPAQEMAPGHGTLKGRVTDAETGEPLPFVNIVLLQNGQQMGGISTDFDGLYTIKPLNTGYYDLSISYIGYDALQLSSVPIDHEKITFQDIQMHSGISLNEFEVVDFEIPLIERDGGSISRFRRDEIRMAGVQTSPRRQKASEKDLRFDKGFYEDIKLEQYDSEDFIANTITTNVANLEYAIDVPFTVRSDGQDYQLRIKEVQVPVEYIYHAVPKLNPEAFLTANLNAWSDLNLLSGPASIYFRGTFTGNTFVDASQTADTLTLSLGRDKNIIAMRQGNRELNDKRIIGNNVRETQAWDLSLRNNRPDSVKVILYDQYPVSELKSVQVELKSHDGAKINDKTGELRWEVMLAPASRGELRFVYEVRYPQGNAALLK